MGAPFFKQAWVSAAVWTNMIGVGMMLGYSTSLLPALQDPESPIRADLHTASWLASVCGISGIPGFMLSSYLMEVYGRKVAHLLLVLPGIAGWLFIYFAQNIPTIMIGRILGGITSGATVTLGAVVIGEYSSPQYRGVFLNLKTVSVYLGGMLVHIISNFLSWRTVALAALMPQAFAILINFTWPESPSWLAARGEFDPSKRSFFWLREKSEASYKELDDLIKSQLERLSQPKVKKRMNDEVIDIFKKFQRKDFLMPVFIAIVSSILLEASGRHFFPAYALQIIGAVSSNKSKSFQYILAIDFIITASALSSSILIKIMKRRTLLFSTGFSAFAVLMVACAYLSWGANLNTPEVRTWLTIGIFIVFFILANLGCTPIPMALLGEVFPLPHRGVGSAVAGICMSLNVMLGLQLTPYLLYHMKVQGMFLVYGLVMGLTLLVLYFVLPETKDRTLQEIEDYFNISNNKDEMKEERKEFREQMIDKTDEV